MDLNASVKTGVVFKNGQIIPKWFVWESRKYNITSINYTWEDKQGRERITRFSVSDDTNSYELAYNSTRTTWRLNKIS